MKHTLITESQVVTPFHPWLHKVKGATEQANFPQSGTSETQFLLGIHYTTMFWDLCGFVMTYFQQEN
jgi:hypothetical protein